MNAKHEIDATPEVDRVVEQIAHGDIFSGDWHTLREIEAERDALRAANAELERIISMHQAGYSELANVNVELVGALGTICALDDGDNPAFWADDAHNAFEIARAALAKSENGKVTP